MGRYFEELEQGSGFSTEPRNVTVEEIDTFIRLTGDDNRLHTDDAFARSQGFEGRIAHGALVVSLATGLAWSTGILTDTTIAFRSIDEWKFTQPVYPGDAIHLRGSVAETRAMPRLKAGLVRFDLEVVNQKGAVVSSGSLKMLMRMKET